MIKMRTIAVWAVVSVLAGAAWAGDMMVRIMVTDDEGAPVAGAEIAGWFGDVSNAGAHDRFAGLTDDAGLLVAHGRPDTYLGLVVRATNHYRASVRYPFVSEDRHGDCLETSFPVTLRRRRAPVAMYARLFENRYVGMVDTAGAYVVGRTAQYDMVVGDYLPPLGDGRVPDVKLSRHTTVHSTNDRGRAVEFETRCEVRFDASPGGVCAGDPYGDLSGTDGSALVSGYEAPGAGYTNAIAIYRVVVGERRETNDDGHYLHYFRIRSQMNERGEVTNALYGKIYGPLNGNFRYYLNPTPNDRNVEFDPGRNLFEDLDPLERVTMP